MSRKVSKRRKDLIGFVLIASSALLFGGLWLALQQLSDKKPLDPETLCPQSGTSTRVAALVDKSDKWGEDDVARVKRVIGHIFTDVPAQGRLSIYAIKGRGRESTNVTTVFDMCNPGSEAECNILYENCREMKHRYEDAFKEPISKLSEVLKVPGQSSYSPLLESIVEVVSETNAPKLRIHVISDFMENGSAFRFYDVVPLTEELVREYPLDSEIQLVVKGHFIDRRRHSRELKEAVKRVWSGYFERQGASVTFDRLFIAE